jgi:CRP-like cAMP-binding protein
MMSAKAEKVAILKSMSLFADADRQILEQTAALLKEQIVHQGETIFSKGDPGQCMYIIAAGKVRVHDGERTLNTLEKWDFFGEMAALDPEPRSASVTAIEDTRLYSLEQEALYGLMQQHPGVTHGIIHALSQRLRNRMRDMAEDFQYMQQFARVTAAAVAVEAGVYQPESLDEVARRTDELGQLGRVFQRMEREVYARERRLKEEVELLKIEVDLARQERQVAEITETEYFRQLRSRARGLRSQQSPEPDDIHHPDESGG